MTAIIILEWLGSGLGLLGAFLLAIQSKASRYGWIVFLLANFAMIGFALGIGAKGLLLQQLGFTVTSVLGIFRVELWPFGPAKPSSQPSAKSAF